MTIGQLSLLDVPVIPGVSECEMTACRICTGCAHSNHGACRGTVKCPNDGQARTCTCCGAAPGQEPHTHARYSNDCEPWVPYVDTCTACVRSAGGGR